MRRAARAGSERLLTVKNLAAKAQVADHVVRFYARSGLIRAARTAGNGYRYFQMSDAHRIRFIRAAQSLGFTIAEIRELLRHSRRGETPCPLARDIIDRRLKENRERLEYVSALQDRMQKARAVWHGMPDQAPRGDSLCSLIEAVSGEESVPTLHRQRGLR